MEDRAFTLELLGMNETEIAYIAGLFDGEGWISAKTQPRSFPLARRIQTGIKMTTPAPLAFCARIFGGRVIPHKTPSNWKQQYEWLLFGSKADTFLRLIEPYLIVKKDKANLAIAFRAYGRGYHPRKLELAELITPHQTKNHHVNPDEPNTNQR